MLTAIGKGKQDIPPCLATQKATLQISHSATKKQSRTSIWAGGGVINWELFVP